MTVSQLDNSQLDKAIRFRELHGLPATRDGTGAGAGADGVSPGGASPGRSAPAAAVLVLVNAWDALSARLVAEAGATAAATTSAGVAWSLGVPDGDRLDRDAALAVAARVAGAVDLPVTADLESGFGADPAGVAETVRRAIEAGVVGVNLEDGPLLARPIQDQTDRYAAARRAADATGIPLYVNARVDVYLKDFGDPATRLDVAVERARAYLAAGADGIFVPGVTDPATVAALVERIPAPLNILVGPGAPDVAELGRLGVARISIGSKLALAAYGLVRRGAGELFGTGGYATLTGGLAYDDVNGLLAAK